MSAKEARKEEAVLHALFSNFASFNFDKVKEQAEKEKDFYRNIGTPLWLGFLSVIAQLSVAEKLNMNLGFMATKGFLRKENSVRATYESLLTDLTELEKKYTPINDKRLAEILAGCSNSSSINTERLMGDSSPGTDGVLLHLCSHVITYIEARIQLITFYECLISASANSWMDYNSLNSSISDISNKNSKLFHHPVLSPLKTNFMFECDILAHLLGSLKDMQNWKFFPALLHLDGAHNKLSSWHGILQSKETKKYGFLKSSPQPPLYQWLVSAKSALVSKFSLYFYETLTRQSTPQEMKSLLSKQSNDYVAKIQAFHRKSDARCVCLVLDTAQVSKYKGHGYHHPNEMIEPLTGIESYAAIFSYPSKPTEFWPNIVLRISDVRKENYPDSKVEYFYDRKFGITCFYCQADPLMTLLALFTVNKSEKDAYIKDFIYDMAHQLRCVKIFANLKLK